LAVRYRPDFADAHNDLALLLLLRGDFERGWREYEWRWRTKHVRSPMSDVRSQTMGTAASDKVWDGSPLGGRTILLHAEQGLGDTIHFIRYVPLLSRKRQLAGANVVVECQPPLLPLLQGIRHYAQLVARGSPLP